MGGFKSLFKINKEKDAPYPPLNYPRPLWALATEPDDRSSTHSDPVKPRNGFGPRAPTHVSGGRMVYTHSHGGEVGRSSPVDLSEPMSGNRANSLDELKHRQRERELRRGGGLSSPAISVSSSGSGSGSRGPLPTPPAMGTGAPRIRPQNHQRAYSSPPAPVTLTSSRPTNPSSPLNSSPGRSQRPFIHLSTQPNRNSYHSPPVPSPTRSQRSYFSSQSAPPTTYHPPAMNRAQVSSSGRSTSSTASKYSQISTSSSNNNNQTTSPSSYAPSLSSLPYLSPIPTPQLPPPPSPLYPQALPTPPRPPLPSPPPIVSTTLKSKDTSTIFLQTVPKSPTPSVESIAASSVYFPGAFPKEEDEEEDEVVILPPVKVKATNKKVAVKPKKEVTTPSLSSSSRTVKPSPSPPAFERKKEKKVDRRGPPTEGQRKKVLKMPEPRPYDGQSWDPNGDNAAFLGLSISGIPSERYNYSRTRPSPPIAPRPPPVPTHSSYYTSSAPSSYFHPQPHHYPTPPQQAYQFQNAPQYSPQYSQLSPAPIPFTNPSPPPPATPSQPSYTPNPYSGAVIDLTQSTSSSSNSSDYHQANASLDEDDEDDITCGSFSTKKDKNKEKSKSSNSGAQCSGTTGSGKRCTRSVDPTTSSSANSSPARKGSPGLSSGGGLDVLDEMMGSDEEGGTKGEGVPRFCFQHSKQALLESGCFIVRRGGRGKGEWIEFEDWILPDLPNATKILLRHEMSKPISDKDEEGFIYCHELVEKRRTNPTPHNEPKLTFLKLGRSVKPVSRLSQWRSQCPSREPIVRDIFPHPPSSHPISASSISGSLKIAEKGIANHHRWERLMLIEVAGRAGMEADLRRGEKKKKEKECCKDCGKMHVELFEVYEGAWEDWVRDVVERWGRWCEMLG